MKQFIRLLPVFLLMISCGTTEVTKDVSSTDEASKQLKIVSEQIENRDKQLRETGVDFVAYGSEPFWILKIDKVKKSLSIEIMGKETQNISLASMEYIDIMNLQIQNSKADIQITSQEMSCIDPASGEVLPYKVIIQIDGDSYSGCGKDLRTSNVELKVIPTQLNDIWALVAVDGKELDFSDKSIFRPMLEIHLKDMKAIGTTGCNNFQADAIIGCEKISFPSFPMTQKYCPGYEAVFVKGITETATYKLENMKLQFFNKEGKEVLRFKKVD